MNNRIFKLEHAPRSVQENQVQHMEHTLVTQLTRYSRKWRRKLNHYQQTQGEKNGSSMLVKSIIYILYVTERRTWSMTFLKCRKWRWPTRSVFPTKAFLKKKKKRRNPSSDGRTHCQQTSITCMLKRSTPGTEWTPDSQIEIMLSGWREGSAIKSPCCSSEDTT